MSSGPSSVGDSAPSRPAPHCARSFRVPDSDLSNPSLLIRSKCPIWRRLWVPFPVNPNRRSRTFFAWPQILHQEAEGFLTLLLVWVTVLVLSGIASVSLKSLSSSRTAFKETGVRVAVCRWVRCSRLLPVRLASSCGLGRCFPPWAKASLSCCSNPTLASGAATG